MDVFLTFFMSEKPSCQYKLLTSSFFNLFYFLLILLPFQKVGPKVTIRRRRKKKKKKIIKKAENGPKQPKMIQNGQTNKFYDPKFEYKFESLGMFSLYLNTTKYA